MSTKGGQGFTFSFPGGRLAPFPPCQLRHCFRCAVSKFTPRIDQLVESKQKLHSI